MDDNIVVNPKDILLEEDKFYKELFQSKETNLVDNENLFKNITTLNHEEQSWCENEITVEELAKSLKELPNNKTPGSDGLSTDFYKFFWTDIKNYVYESIQSAFQTGTLSIEQRRGILNVIPKKDKDIRLLKNWRPISLLNTDYKILTKLLAKRLQKVIPSIVSTDQTGYIKNRYIGENIRTITDIIQYTALKNIPGILLQLDFEKAFDTISWNVLHQTLEQFGFGNDLKLYIMNLNVV